MALGNQASYVGGALVWNVQCQFGCFVVTVLDGQAEVLCLFCFLPYGYGYEHQKQKLYILVVSC